MRAAVPALCLVLLLAGPAGAAPAACTASPELACLAGRAGGQRLQGGLAPGDALTLAGPGAVRVDGPLALSPALPDADATAATISPARTLENRRIVGIDMSPALRWTRAGGLFGFRFGGTHEVDADPTAVNFMTALHVSYTSRSTKSGVAPWFPDMIVEQWTAELDGAQRLAMTGLIPIAFAARPVVKATNGAALGVTDRCAPACQLGANRPCRPETEATDCAGCATGTAGSCSDRGGLVTLYAYPTLHAGDGSNLYLSRRAVVYDRGAALETVGSGSVQLGTDNTLLIADRSGARSTRAVESLLRDGPGKFFLHASGDAPSVHAGKLRIGDATPPRRSLEVIGDGSVSGSVRVGDAAPPTAGVDLAPGRDKHVRMAGAAEDPAAPAPGDVWYNTTQMAHRTRAAAGTLALSGVLKTVTSDSEPIAGTAAETAFSNGAVLLPARSLAAGKTIRLRAGGRYASGGVAPRLTLRWGATPAGDANLLVDTGAPPLGGRVADGGWTLDADITVRAVGAAGGAAARGTASFGGAGGAAVVATDGKTGTTPIDTTVATPLTMLAAWAGGQAAGSITLETLTVEVLD